MPTITGTAATVVTVTFAALAAAALAAGAATVLAAEATGATSAGRGAPAVTATPAPPTPEFLAASDLPPNRFSPWYAEEAKAGLPEHGVHCVRGALPTAGTRSLMFHTEVDAETEQVIVRTGSAAAATRLLDALDAEYGRCVQRTLEQLPGGTAETRVYAWTPADADGVRIYGRHSAHADTEHSVGLLGVARVGNVVTVVDWGQMGELEDEHVAPFVKTMAVASDLLLG